MTLRSWAIVVATFALSMSFGTCLHDREPRDSDRLVLVALLCGVGLFPMLFLLIDFIYSEMDPD